VLAQVAMDATSRRKALDLKMDAAKENSRGNTLSTPLMLAPACCTERGQAIGMHPIVVRLVPMSHKATLLAVIISLGRSGE